MNVQLIWVWILFLCTLFSILDTKRFCTEKIVNVGFIVRPNSTIDKGIIDDIVKLANISKSDKNERIYINQTVDIIDISDPYALHTVISKQRQLEVVAIVLMADKNSLESIQSYSMHFNLPFVISTASHLTLPGHQGVVQGVVLSPPYIPAIVDFIRHNKWKRVFFIFDSDEGLYRLEQLNDIQNKSKEKLELSFHRISRNNTLVYSALHRIDRSGHMCSEKVFILDFESKASTRKFLKQLIRVGMNKFGYHYIISGFEIEAFKDDFKVFEHGGANITGFQLMQNNVIVEKLKRTLQRKTDFTVEEALFVDGVAILQTTFHNLFNYNKTTQTIFKSQLCKLHMTPEKGYLIIKQLKKTKLIAPDEGLTGHIAFDERGYRKDYQLAIYTCGFKEPLHLIGNWSSEYGLLLSPRDKPSMKNRPIIITTVKEPPFYYMKKDSGEAQGLIIDLINLLNKTGILKHEFVIKPRNDSAYGEEQEDGTWNGMIGELIDGDADIAIAPITITEVRQKVVDFTKPFMRTGLSIMIYKPRGQKPGVFSFKEPLDNLVWLCIAFGFLCTSVILFLIGRFSPFEWSENSEEGPSSDFNFLNSLWSSLGALMQQGSDISPRSLSGRCAESAWWFFTLILVSSYTANLAAFLTVEKLDIQINSAEDLVNQDRVKYGIKSDGSTEEFFRRSKVITYEKMWVEMNQSLNVMMESNEDGQGRVQMDQGRYAFILEGVFNEYLNQQLPCNTIKVGGFLNTIDYAIALQKNSHLTKEVNLAILRLRERGDFHKLKTKWWYDKGQCKTGGGTARKKSLSLSNVSGMFHILITGLVISMTTAVVEYIINNRIKQQCYKVQKAKKNLKEMAYRKKEMEDVFDSPEKQVQRRKKSIEEITFQTKDIEDVFESPDEEKPLRPLEGFADNKGYQTLSPANLIVFDGMDNGCIPGTLI